MWEEFQCVGDSDAVGDWHVALIISEVLEGRSHIVSPGCMFCPGFSLICSVVDGYFASWGSQGCCIVVKVTMDHCIC